MISLYVEFKKITQMNLSAKYRLSDIENRLVVCYTLETNSML